MGVWILCRKRNEERVRTHTLSRRPFLIDSKGVFGDSPVAALEIYEDVFCFFSRELLDGRDAVAELLQRAERGRAHVDENREERKAEPFLFVAEVLGPFGIHLAFAVSDKNNIAFLEARLLQAPQGCGQRLLKIRPTTGKIFGQVHYILCF